MKKRKKAKQHELIQLVWAVVDHSVQAHLSAIGDEAQQQGLPSVEEAQSMLQRTAERFINQPDDKMRVADLLYAADVCRQLQLVTPTHLRVHRGYEGHGR